MITDLTLPRTYSTWRATRPANRAFPLWTLIAGWIERSHQRKSLADLDDHMLRDIGVTRYDARLECRKKFWQ